MFTIHSALVAAQSPAFERLVNSEFKEAQDRRAELEDVDEATFIRFVQYAYTGEYEDGLGDAPPDNGKRHSAEDETKIEAEPGKQDAYGILDFSTMKSRKKTSVSKVAVFEALSEKFKTTVSKLQVEEPNELSPLREELQQNAFLIHARMFVFADYWGVMRLKEISLQKLGKALGEARVKKRRVRDLVVDLVEYCYEDARPDELVGFVLMYAASKLPSLWISTRFQETFGEHKGLSVGLVRAIIEAGM